jgi:dephospho-CoA kinase
VLQPSGELDRAKLREIVFADADKRRQLNKVTHIPIFLTILRQIIRCAAPKHCPFLSSLTFSSSHSLTHHTPSRLRFVERQPLVVLDAPLLFETKMHFLCKRTIAVTASESVQLARLQARDGVDRQHAEEAARAQMSAAFKASLADVVIDNSQLSLQELEARVLAVFRIS